MKRFALLIVIFLMLAGMTFAAQGNSNLIELGHWSGQGIKSTTTFTIPEGKEWMIIWEEKGNGYFGIMVYREGKLSDMVANVVGPHQDSTIMRTSGKHYLKILGDHWRVMVLVEP